MKRLSVLAAIALLAVGCAASATALSSNKPTFVATLSPANEVPPVTNAESVVAGNVQIVLDTTTDAGGNVTAATAAFTISLTGIPAGSAINVAHIHEGDSTCACPVRVNTTLASGQTTITNGIATIQKDGVPVTAEVAQRLMNNPGGFYFNVHSTLNPGGVARGQLVRIQ